jgi:hypothetical protein
VISGLGPSVYLPLSREVSRDSRQPARGRSRHRDGPTRSLCPVCGAEVEKHARSTPAGDDDGGSGEPWKPDTCVRGSGTEPRGARPGRTEHRRGAQAPRGASSGASPCLARRDLSPGDDSPGVDSKGRWRRTGPWHSRCCGPVDPAGCAPRAQSALGADLPYIEPWLPTRTQLSHGHRRGEAVSGRRVRVGRRSRPREILRPRSPSTFDGAAGDEGHGPAAARAHSPGC